ncbi:MAG TPA: glycosyltransferase family 39 protein [Thermoanaerobaculia bacterium]|nr:glycosyltransferase family 39 protein [Thermoanaerobaculia bacterium]
MSAETRRWRAALLAAFVLALLLRLLAVGLLQGFGSPPDAHAQPDQLDYERTAWALASGEGYAVDGQPSSFRPPGTAFALAPVYLLAGRSWAAGRLWFCLLSAATCVALALLARPLCGPTVALGAAIALALDPAHLYYSLHFLSEVPYGLLITTATAFALAAARAEETRRGALLGLAAGGVLGLAGLVRPQALLALPIAWLLWLVARGPTRRRVSAALLAASLATAAVAGAWVARNALVFGEPRLATIAGVTFWGAHNERVLAEPGLCGLWVSTRPWIRDLSLPRDEALYNARGWAQGAAFVRRHWRSLPRLELCKLERLIALRLATPNRLASSAFAIAWLLVGPLALVGFVGAWRRDRASAMVAGLPLFALVATALLFYGSIRFRHSTEPILVLFAGAGASMLAARLGSPRTRGGLMRRPG